MEQEKLNREELITLVQRIIVADGTGEEIDKMIEVLNENVLDPKVSDLIFYEELTAEEVVDRALAYKPFEL